MAFAWIWPVLAVVFLIAWIFPVLRHPAGPGEGKGHRGTQHIHVPASLEIDDVDLNSLLSNMLENAIGACMRMKARAGTGPVRGTDRPVPAGISEKLWL